METNAPPWTLEQIARLVGGTCDGPPGLCLERVAPADSADPRGIGFAESAEFWEKARASGIGALIVPPEAPDLGKPCVRVANPRAAFGMLLHLADRPMPLEKGIHGSAVVHADARVHPEASVGPYAVIEREAEIGPGVQVFPFCYVGEGCSVGEGCVLYPHAVLYRGVVLGPRTVVHSGAVLGADGFGYGWDGTRRVKVPQVGRVRVGADVEIGANTTVDRATMGETTIGEGTKIDNLVQVAHNVSIGRHGAIAAKSGIAGSSKVGDRVIMGGDVGVTDHVSIVDDVSLGARTGVEADIDEPGEYFGVPARPKREAIRAMLIYVKLPELAARIRELERRLRELEGGR